MNERIQEIRDRKSKVADFAMPGSTYEQLGSDIDYLLSEVERLQTTLYTHQSYDKTAGELHEDNQILISALEWYANKGNYDPVHLETLGKIPIDADEGRRSRAALSKVGGQKMVI
ncbi:hypothetical protein [Paenibacillus senegalimassiliensis]|uniref:hypothetical protein n=1 Tax=Paenibacillus senegalimassiliensis TaxID=1737426 RepID=UPI00073EBF3E|nr:hypothetical protein [Paenibacillus senegalimassiliensis]